MVDISTVWFETGHKLTAEPDVDAAEAGIRPPAGADTQAEKIAASLAERRKRACRYPRGFGT